jgi:hypothetical protein
MTSFINNYKNNHTIYFCLILIFRIRFDSRSFNIMDFNAIMLEIDDVEKLLESSISTQPAVKAAVVSNRGGQCGITTASGAAKNTNICCGGSTDLSGHVLAVDQSTSLTNGKGSLRQLSSIIKFTQISNSTLTNYHPYIYKAWRHHYFQVDYFKLYFPWLCRKELSTNHNVSVL